LRIRSNRVSAASVKKSACIRRSRHGTMICAALAMAASLKSSAGVSQPCSHWKRASHALPQPGTARTARRLARRAARKSRMVAGAPPASRGVVPLRYRCSQKSGSAAFCDAGFGDSSHMNGSAAMRHVRRGSW
jgi:hypothetical protein